MDEANVANKKSDFYLDEAAPTLQMTEAGCCKHVTQKGWVIIGICLLLVALVIVMIAVLVPKDSKGTPSSACPSMVLLHVENQLASSLDGTVVIIICDTGAQVDLDQFSYTAKCENGKWNDTQSCTLMPNVMPSTVPSAERTLRPTVLSSTVPTISPTIAPNTVSTTTPTPISTIIPTTAPAYCQEAYDLGQTTSGMYTISLPGNSDGNNTLNVWCEQEMYGGGWIVIQRRVDGSFDFNQTWAAYKAGFGNASHEVWLGNENLYLLTRNQTRQLKIEMVDKDDSTLTYIVDYDEFSVADEENFYKLHLGQFRSDTLTYNAMALNHRRPFSTYDSAGDTCGGGTVCAETRGGGWWYWCCSFSSLNGLYDGYLWWKAEGSGHIHLSAARMLIR